MMGTIKNQKQEFTKLHGKCVHVAEIRHDDSCGNGHNSFAVTCTTYRLGVAGSHPGDRIEYMGKRYSFDSGGCCHDTVRKHFPEFSHLIRWHLCDTREPMHYQANAAYYAGLSRAFCPRKGEPKYYPANLDGFISTTVWGALPGETRETAAELLASLVPADTARACVSNGETDDTLKARLSEVLAPRAAPLRELMRADVEALGMAW